MYKTKKNFLSAAIFCCLASLVLPAISAGQASPADANPTDDPDFFVRQHYLDFLNRTADSSGLAVRVNQITSCNGNAQCVDLARQNVSAGFFLSREFQQTGYYVIKLQRVAFGKFSNDPTKRLSFSQWLTDAQAVGAGFIDGQPGADAVLDQNQTTYARSVAGSAAFITTYPTTLSASEYVDALFAAAGVIPQDTERQIAINAFGTGDTAGRAAVLRTLARIDTVKDAECNPGFVLMQYFGYLRRAPTDPPDNNDDGYQFWLGRLNQFNGDYLRIEMVRSFILSTEYRTRFGAPLPQPLREVSSELATTASRCLSSPLSIPASVSGRVTGPDGRGLRNASVSITDSNHVKRTSTTSSFGYYSFDNVATGQDYTIAISSRLYRFAPRVVRVSGDLANVDFVGLE